MPASSSDRNLLFGILALQMDFVSPSDLIVGMQAWVNEKEKSLGEIFLTRKLLKGSQLNAIESLVDLHIEKHGGIEQSLCVLGQMAPQLGDIRQLADADLQRSIDVLRAGMTKNEEVQRPSAPLLFEPVETQDGHFSADIPTSIVTKADGNRTIRMFGDYQVHSQLGRGGMGVVFKATHLPLKRTVALKMIKAGQLSSEREITRFRLEAESAARLDHPGIVPIHEIGLHQGQHFFAMGFVDGESLADIVREGPLPPNEAAELVRQSAVAVHHAHERGIIHRDLKPANILIAREAASMLRAKRDSNATKLANRLSETPRSSTSGHQQVKVTDFGLAKRIDDDAGMTHTGDVMGTPSYMAPEQAKGEKSIGVAADVYGLGAILYHLLTGRPPFQTATSAQTIYQVIATEPASVCGINPNVDADLETICHKCLQKDPAKRYASAEELANDLVRRLRGEPILARPISRRERLVRWSRRNPTIAALSAAVCLIAVLSTCLAIWAVGQAKRASHSESLAKSNESKAKEETKRANDQTEKTIREKTRADLEAKTARVKEQQANVESERANEQAKLAKKRTKEAVESERTAKRSLYASHMNLVQQMWESNNLGPMGELLDRYRTQQKGAEDLRGFEWYHWNYRIHEELRTFKGHSHAVFSVIFSPDGTRLASGSYDNTVKLWDVRTGLVLQTFNGHDDFVSSVSFSPDGTRLASGGYDKTIKLWDARTGSQLQTLKGHSGVVDSVSFSPDGTRLASGSSDTTVKLWDTVTGSELQTLKGHSSSVSTVSFSPDGTHFASGSYDGTVKLWDARTGSELQTLKGHLGIVNSVSFSPDGTRVASGSYDRTAKLWDARTGWELQTFRGHSSSVDSVSFSPDGTRLASGSYDKTIKLWDARTGSELQTHKGHSSSVTCVSFSPDGTRLASGSWDTTVKLWDARQGSELLTLKGHSGSVDSVSFSPDGMRLVSGSYDNTVKLWDARTSSQLLTLIGHSGFVDSVRFSSDGTRLASGSEDKTVKFWDTRTGSELQTLQGHSGIVSSVSFSPDGTRLASGSYDKTVKLWDVRTGSQLKTCKGHLSAVNSVSFSPDGTRLASGSRDRTVKLWDARTGSQLQTLKGHSGAVNSVSFSSDGTRLATGSEDKTVKLWDTRTGSELLTLQGRSSPVSSVSFSSDGTRLASTSYSTVKLWDGGISSDEMEDRKCRSFLAGIKQVPMIKEEIINYVQSSKTLSDTDRPKLLEIARELKDEGPKIAVAALERTFYRGGTGAFRDRTLFLAQTACKLQNRDDLSLRALAGAHYRLGRIQDATKALRDRKSSGNDDGEFLCLEAMIWSAAGDKIQAEACLTQAENSPDSIKPGFPALHREAEEVLYGKVQNPREKDSARRQVAFRLATDTLAISGTKSKAKVDIEKFFKPDKETRELAVKLLEFMNEPQPPVPAKK